MNINGITIDKKYLLIGIIAVVLLVIVVIYILTRNPNKQPSSGINNLSPTANTLVPDTAVTTTQITSEPLPFTGAEDPQLNTDEIKQIDQERALRKKSPYNGVTFIVEYNYKTYNFEVKSTGNNEVARQDFTIWINNNFPTIDKNLFVFIDL
ncbi:hypothetical protein BH09PAT2_BH09PAT2_00270 [soil metagenome]